MIPGMGKALRNMDMEEDAFKGTEAIIRSMTPDERKDPKILNGSRRKRIADGSGTSVQEVNRLIKQFSETRKMMKKMKEGKGNGMKDLMNNMQGMKGNM
jgi:signal recognition particle subunit SRP54